MTEIRKIEGILKQKLEISQNVHSLGCIFSPYRAQSSQWIVYILVSLRNNTKLVLLNFKHLVIKQGEGEDCNLEKVVGELNNFHDRELNLERRGIE